MPFARIASCTFRTAVALAAGVACGALLVAAYIYSSLGEPLVFEGLLRVAVFYGFAIAAICAPIWLVLAAQGWDRAPVAALLGFAATTVFMLLTTTAGSHPKLHLLTYTFIPYALCGAVAALVTWWVGRLLAKPS